MIAKKVPTYRIISFFLYFFFISIIIVNTDLPHIPWQLEGGLISLALLTPLLIHIAKTDKKPLPIIIINSAILGTLISFAAHYLR